MRAWFGVPALMAVCLVAAQQPEDTLEPPGQQEAAVVVIGLSGDGITATPNFCWILRSRLALAAKIRGSLERLL